MGRVSFLHPWLLKDTRLTERGRAYVVRNDKQGGPGRATNLRRGHKRHMLSGLTLCFSWNKKSGPFAH